MSNQGGSCCGPADEATTEPAKPTEGTERAIDDRTAAYNATPRERGASGLLQVVRRFFRVPA